MEGVRKHRGLKRYYKNLAIGDDFNKMHWLTFDTTEGWQNYQHFHFDWSGYGDNSFKRRKPHLDKLFRHFDMLVERTKDLKTGFQLYTILLDYSSRSDALFLHKPDPDYSQFQFKISDLEPSTTLTNKSLNDYINELTGYEKRYGQADQAFCLIFKENVGQFF